MHLLELPVEIGALIFDYLDLTSKLMAHSVKELRQFYAPSLMRKLDLSRSSAASVKTVYLLVNVFQDWASAANIHELNLSGITDLTAHHLSPHIQRCVNMKSLDVTFTSVLLQDLDAICPENLKNISINFLIRPHNNERTDAWKKSVHLFQRQRFEYVNFIISESERDAPLLFMNDVPKTKCLKISVLDNLSHSSSSLDSQEESDEDALPPVERNIIYSNFEKLIVVYHDCDIPDLEEFETFSKLNYNNIEYIFIMYSPRVHGTVHQIYVSPIFSSLFANNCSQFNIVVNTYLHLDILLEGNLYCWFSAWNKSFTEFNDAFFKSVLIELTDFFPTYLCTHNKTEMKLTQAPSSWYCIDTCRALETVEGNLPEKVTLTDFCCNKKRIVREGLSRPPVYLTPQSNTWKNITFLKLRNIGVTGDFFDTLFKYCKNLYTLDVDIDFQELMLSLRYSMHLTKSLKNMRVTAFNIEFEMLFASLCQCPTLENIHIDEIERDAGNIVGTQNMVLLIQKCVGLYSLFIETFYMRTADWTLVEFHLKAAAQKFGRDYLRIRVCENFRGWNPFVDVFNPSPLNIVD